MHTHTTSEHSNSTATKKCTGTCDSCKSKKAAALAGKHLLHQPAVFHLERIGVAVDLSEQSAGTIRFAWQIAHLVGAKLEVVYAMNSIFDGHTPSKSGFLGSYEQTMQQEIGELVQVALKKIEVDYRPAHFTAPTDYTELVPITPRVMYGYPEEVLAAYSGEVDLLVLGTQGVDKGWQSIFGSVSRSLTQHAQCPLLLVPHGASFIGFNNILYASNFDSLQTDQIRKATGLGELFDSQMHFVHVGAEGVDELNSERRLFEAVYADSSDSRPFLYRQLPGSDVVGLLHEYAFYHGIELMVFVVHHRPFWEQLFHHSVSAEAAGAGLVPVLVMQAE
jgi:nucleotide-binding universal stress UspA family protein